MTNTNNKTKIEALTKLYNETLKNGGATISPNLVQPDSGYMVATIDLFEEQIHDDNFTFEAFVNGFDNCASINYCAGFWLNPENNLWYIEPSELFTIKAEARMIAKQRKQIAYYDLSKQETVNV